MKQIVQKIIVAGIVIDNGKALIIQRSGKDAFPDLWELPSGKRDDFEKSKDALKREVKEETGLNIEPLVPVHVFEFRVEKEKEIRDSTQISFLVKPVGKGQVKLSKEHQNFAWVSKDGLNKYNLSTDTKNAIIKGFKYLRISK